MMQVIEIASGFVILHEGSIHFPDGTPDILLDDIKDLLQRPEGEYTVNCVKVEIDEDGDFFIAGDLYTKGEMTDIGDYQPTTDEVVRLQQLFDAMVNDADLYELVKELA